MNIKMIMNLILGKKIVVYNNHTKEIICILGGNEEIFKNRYTYDFIKDEYCIEEVNGKVVYKNENN